LEAEASVVRLHKAMEAGRLSSQARQERKVANEIRQEATPSLMRRRGKQHRLSLEEKVDVVWRVKVLH
jgi:hypothetical protein